MSRSSRVYVGNLPIDVRERELEDMFYKFGRIDRIEVKRLDRPPVFAFISFRDARDAWDAVKRRNGIDFDGRRLRVELTNEKKNAPSGVTSDNTKKRRTTYQVRVSGLSGRISWQDLKDFGRQVGSIVHSDVFGNNGTGVLEYVREEDARRAVHDLDGKICKNPFEECTVRLVLGFDIDNNDNNDNNDKSTNKGLKDQDSSRRRSRSRSRSRSRDRRNDSGVDNEIAVTHVL